MSELSISKEQRLALKAQAHHLNPVVLMGAQGLSDALRRETDRALAAHELIKIKLTGETREERETLLAELASALAAAPIAVIGKLGVLFRPRPAAEAAPVAERSKKAPAAKTRVKPAAKPDRTHADKRDVRRTARPTAPRSGRR